MPNFHPLPQYTHGKRRRRVHAILVLITLFTVTFFVTLQTGNVVSEKILGTTVKHSKFDGGLGSISPSHKEKVGSFMTCVLTPSAKIYTPTLTNVNSC